MKQLVLIWKQKFVNCFEKWKGCNDKCVNFQEECFEKDYGAIALGRQFFCYYLMTRLFLDRTYNILVIFTYTNTYMCT